MNYLSCPGFCPHLQDSCGSIWQDLNRQHSRTRSHLLVDELLLGARLHQPRVWSQHHLCSVIQTRHPTLHLGGTSPVMYEKRKVKNMHIFHKEDIKTLLGVPTCTTSRGRPQVSMPELKYHVWVVLRRESGLLSINGSKLAETKTQRPQISNLPVYGPGSTLQLHTHTHTPVVTNSRQPGDVQHQRGVQWAWLCRLALRWRRAFVTQHAGPSHPPQLGALPRLLHNNHS